MGKSTISTGPFSSSQTVDNQRVTPKTVPKSWTETYGEHLMELASWFHGNQGTLDGWMGGWVGGLIALGD